MIKVTLRSYPTNHTSNHVRMFNSLEDAMRKVSQMDKITVAIEEEGVGFHMVPLTEKGEVSLSPLNYGAPRDGKMYYSEKYNEIEKKLSDEKRNPKLA